MGKVQCAHVLIISPVLNDFREMGIVDLVSVIITSNIIIVSSFLPAHVGGRGELVVQDTTCKNLEKLA